MNDRLPYPTLMLVADRHRSVTPFTDAVLTAMSAGVDLVQLREPNPGDVEISQLARTLVASIGPDRLLLNGRPELAGLLGLGTHLRDGQSSGDIGRPDKGSLIGQSIHGDRSNQPDERSDYLLAGNVFESRTHPGRPGRGIGWLTGVVQSSPVPVLAIGGITAGNVINVMRSGCHGVAVIDAILAVPDPGAATVALRRALDQAVQDERVADGRTRTGISHRETAT